MNTIIISDLHIGSRFFLSQDFESFIGNLPEDENLALNGDVIDNPHQKLGSRHQGALDLIEQISYRRRVVWVRGNHDNGTIRVDVEARINLQYITIYTDRTCACS